MQAVILAAGLGTRLRPLTLHTPKALIPIGEKTLIEHTLEALPESIDEIILVVNYLGDQIQAKLGKSFRNIPIHYITQTELNGTGGAMMLLQQQLRDRFLVLNGDDIYAKSDLEQLVAHETSILLSPTTKPLHFGAQINTEGKLTELAPSENETNYRVCGAYVLDQSYFSVSPVRIQGSEHEEYGLPQTLAVLAQRHPIQTIITDKWFPVGTEEELTRVRSLNLS